MNAHSFPSEIRTSSALKPVNEPGERNLVRCHRTDELARRAHVLLAGPQA